MQTGSPACLQLGMPLFSPAPVPAFSTVGLRRGALALCLSAWGVTGLAQTLPAPAPADSPTLSERPSPKVERFVHEDAGSRVDELRIGGQTRQIDVQTKSGLPAYQIQPESGAQGPASAAGQRSGLAGSPGRSSWRLVNF